MFRIKVCGITSPSDARALAGTQVDAAGLNFYPRSPRYVEQRLAQDIVAALPPGIVKVGVFVNAPSHEVCNAFDRLGLDLVQLHGDEPPEYLQELGGRPAVRALRCQSDLQPIRAYLDRCADLNCLPRMILVDAYQEHQYGGTGQRADWAALAADRSAWGSLPLVLAGGLTPENVAQAIDTVRPTAVDTASGVETSPGKKSPDLIQAFAAAASAAFDAINKSAP